ncbi:MAG: peptidase dimerization domain-containing protein [Clostridium sp.]
MWKMGVPGKIVVGSRYSRPHIPDSYKITVHGKAAHSSTPEEGVDAVYIKPRPLVTALHGIISRNLLRWIGRP